MSTKINWENKSTNFWWGCTRISDGCDHCYAESDCRSTGRGEQFYQNYGWKLTGALTSPFRVWGKDFPRLIPKQAKLWERMQNYDRMARAGKRRIRVFVNSMSDFFEKRDDLKPARERAWQIIRATPNVDWCILTKRHENILRCLPEDYKQKPWPNVWLGVSTETQQMADVRLKHLVPIMRDLKPAIFFLGVEPLLESLNLGEYLDSGVIGWAFAGGESDQEPNPARPTHLQWVKSVVSQFQKRKIPIHFKQWGSWAPAGSLKDAGIALGIDGELVHTPLSEQGYAHLKTPVCLLQHTSRHHAGDEIDGESVRESPKNYLNWKHYSEWDIVAKHWSLPGKYVPLKMGGQ